MSSAINIINSFVAHLNATLGIDILTTKMFLYSSARICEDLWAIGTIFLALGKFDTTLFFFAYIYQSLYTVSQWQYSEVKRCTSIDSQIYESDDVETTLYLPPNQMMPALPHVQPAVKGKLHECASHGYREGCVEEKINDVLWGLQTALGAPSESLLLRRVDGSE